MLAFNDLGMHCADLDYSTFVILPPFNVVHAQVIERGAEPRILNPTEVDLSYKAQRDAADSINTTSQNQPGAFQKTNFWDVNPETGNRYVFDLFGLNPEPDDGLAFGHDLHPFGRDACTGGMETPLAFDFHNAQSARP